LKRGRGGHGRENNKARHELNEHAEARFGMTGEERSNGGKNGAGERNHHLMGGK